MNGIRLLLPFVLLLISLAGCLDVAGTPGSLKEANRAYLRGEYLKAEDHYQQFIRAHPDHPERWEAWNRLLSISRHIRRDTERAIDILEAMYLEFGDHQTRSWQVLRTLGQELIKRGETERAITAWEKGLEIPGTPPEEKWEVAEGLARVHFTQGNIVLSRSVLHEAGSWNLSREHQAERLYEMAKLSLYEEDLEEAKRELKAVSQFVESGTHTSTLATFMLADIHEQEGDFQTALILFQSIEDDYPNPGTVAKRIAYLKEQLEQ